MSATDIVYRCHCSWVGGDPDIGPRRRTKKPTCPACWKHDRRRVVVVPEAEFKPKPKPKPINVASDANLNPELQRELGNLRGVMFARVESASSRFVAKPSATEPAVIIRDTTTDREATVGLFAARETMKALAALFPDVEAPPAFHGTGELALAQAIDAATHHAEDSEPDMEVGDLQGMVRDAWALLTPEQRLKLWNDGWADHVAQWSP